MSITEATKVVTFRLGDDLFAADIFAVERVLRYHTPVSVPDVPDWIEGMIDYRGKVVPVIDLRRRFELPPQANRDSTRILVCNAGTEWIGAIVDAVLEVTTIEPSAVTDPPPLFRGLTTEYLKGIVRRKDRLIIFLDIARLLTTSERLALELATDKAAGP